MMSPRDRFLSVLAFMSMFSTSSWGAPIGLSSDCSEFVSAWLANKEYAEDFGRRFGMTTVVTAWRATDGKQLVFDFGAGKCESVTEGCLPEGGFEIRRRTEGGNYVVSGTHVGNGGGRFRLPRRFIDEDGRLFLSLLLTKPALMTDLAALGSDVSGLSVERNPSGATFRGSMGSGTPIGPVATPFEIEWRGRSSRPSPDDEIEIRSPALRVKVRDFTENKP